MKGETMNSKLIKKIYIIILTAFIFIGFQSIEAEGNELNFDGSQSNWAEPELQEAVEYNLTYPSVMKNFKKDITREEFSTLAVKLYEGLTADKATVGTDPFVDTNNSEVLKAYNLGIVQGKSSTIFAPKDYITRQEISVMIFRALKVAIPEINKTVTGDFPFSDTKDIASWALNPVKFAYQNNIMKGSNGKILPLDNTTREQAIVLLKRTYVNFKNRVSQEETIQEEYVDKGLQINTTIKNTGIIKVGYSGKSTEKVKVMIEKEGKRYV